MIADVGPNFAKGLQRIGRDRLPYGLVAILDDDVSLVAALAELQAYATADPTKAKPRRGVVFRAVSPRDRDAFHYKLHARYGATLFAEMAEVFDVAAARWHVVDHEHLLHVWNRHSNPAEERLQGQVAVTVDDLRWIPLAVRPANVVDFQVTKGMGRICYRLFCEREGYDVVLVQEVRRRDGLIVKTIYKERR